MMTTMFTYECDRCACHMESVAGTLPSGWNFFSLRQGSREYGPTKEFHLCCECSDQLHWPEINPTTAVEFAKQPEQECEAIFNVLCRLIDERIEAATGSRP